MWKDLQNLGIADTSVGREMATVKEEERLGIIARAANGSKIAAAMQNSGFVNELGTETDKDIKFALRELKALFDSAKGDEDVLFRQSCLLHRPSSSPWVSL